MYYIACIIIIIKADPFHTQQVAFPLEIKAQTAVNLNIKAGSV